MEPTSPQLRRVKSCVSPASWERRVKHARKDEKPIERILKAAEAGATLNGAIARVLPRSRRSWAYRRLPRYREAGFEALIDARTPREARVSKACSDVVEGARLANPRLSVREAQEILEMRGIKPIPSATTMKRLFARADRKCAAAKRKRETKSRESASPKGEDPPAPAPGGGSQDLPFAGGELLLAAEAETGVIAALTDEVVKASEWAKEVAGGQVPDKDVEHRDELGHFTAEYNEARRRQPGKEVASYLRTAQEKAEERVPTWPRFVHEPPHTLEQKNRMLVFGWMLDGKGWEGLKSRKALGLAPLTGFAYMPSTMAKYVSALAISGLGPPLQARLSETWHGVAQKYWGEPGAMAAIYIDNQCKEVWTDLFTMAGKVSHRNKVMPCITTTYAHTGAGTPVVLSVQSGSAPLAPRLVELVDEAEATLGGTVRRAVVVDAEGSVFDVLEAFDEAERVIVTPLRPSRAPELKLTYSRGSYFRPYRENDELRIAGCTLQHKSSGRSLDLGALVIRRNHRDHDMILLTTGLRHGLEGRDLADLYFKRWPVQEGAFKDAMPLGLNRHRGNCGRMVANVAVVTELEKLEQRAKRDMEAHTKLAAETDALVATAAERRKQSERAQSFLDTRRRRLDEIVKEAKTGGKAFTRIALDHQQALVRAEESAAALEKARTPAEKNQARRTALEERIAKTEERRKELEPQRVIRQLDVAQDSILTAMKLTASLLIAFVLREYLPSMPMTTETFLRRVFDSVGHKEVDRAEERVYFYENPRDVEVTAALRDACLRLNQRGIRREGRLVRYAVVPEPLSRAGPAAGAGWFG